MMWKERNETGNYFKNNRYQCKQEVQCIAVRSEEDK
jgi:hypothetical protein